MLATYFFDRALEDLFSFHGVISTRCIFPCLLQPWWRAQAFPMLWG